MHAHSAAPRPELQYYWARSTAHGLFLRAGLTEGDGKCKIGTHDGSSVDLS